MKNTVKRLIFNMRMLLEHPFVEIQDVIRGGGKSEAVIPRKVYQTWETRFIGKTHYKQIKEFQDINPDFDFILFDKKNRDLYMQDYWGSHLISEIYNNAQFGPMKADIFRYCILYERGGVYFDISKGCSVPLKTLLAANLDGLLSFESGQSSYLPSLECMKSIQHPEKLCLQWGMGFKKGHIILEKMISNICDYYPFYKGRVFESPKSAILQFTGPGMFTKSVRDVASLNGLGNINQAGIDFNGHGIFEMKGAWARYSQVPPYEQSKSRVIVL